MSRAYRTARIVILLAALVSSACAPTASNQTHRTLKNQKDESGRNYGYITFYEGYNGSQNSFCEETISSLPYVAKGRICKNDEAKSMRFDRVPAGAVVIVYDDPDCGTHADWEKITTLQRADPPITVWNFEDNDADDPRYLINYHHVSGGNLDGKVSCRSIYVPSRP